MEPKKGVFFEVLQVIPRSWIQDCRYFLLSKTPPTKHSVPDEARPNFLREASACGLSLLGPSLLYHPENKGEFERI